MVMDGRTKDIVVGVCKRAMATRGWGVVSDMKELDDEQMPESG